MKKHLGFIDGGTTADSASLTSTHVMAVGGHILDVFIKSNLSQCLAFDSVICSGATSSVVWSVPLTEPAFSIVYYNGSTSSPIRCNPQHQPLTELTFALEDKYGNEIDLNGQSMSLSILIEFCKE
jgi:hypothetical protein